jgi:acylphosphatase
VYLEAEGEEEQLKQLEKWLHVGSPMSRVNRIEVEWTEPTDEYSTFEMKF